MYPKPLAVIALACLMAGCACTTKPSALVPGHSAGREGSAPGGAHDAPGPPGAAGARVQPDALATPEDVLAHVRDYGLYCRKLEAGYRGLVGYTKDIP